MRMMEKKQEQPGAYQRDQEKNQEIGDEFQNPDAAMEEATIKIQKMYRGHLGRKEIDQKKQQMKK